MTPFPELVGQMRAVADRLIPHTRPFVTPQHAADVAVLKSRVAVLDGYEVSLYYSREDYRPVGKPVAEALMVTGWNGPLIPFYLSCKIARAFLGDEGLILTNVADAAGNVGHLWTVYRDDGRVVPVSGEVQSHHGLKFTRLAE